MPRTPQPDPRVTKRRVTMSSAIIDAAGAVHIHRAEDYVLPEVLDAYVVHARLRWQAVTVSDGVDAGPGGFDGPTHIPHGTVVPRPDGTAEYQPLQHPLAGTFRPATGEEWHPGDPANPANSGVVLDNPVATAHHLGVPPAEVHAHPKFAAARGAHRTAEQKG